MRNISNKDTIERTIEIYGISHSVKKDQDESMIIDKPDGFYKVLKTAKPFKLYEIAKAESYYLEFYGQTENDDLCFLFGKLSKDENFAKFDSKEESIAKISLGNTESFVTYMHLVIFPLSKMIGFERRLSPSKKQFSNVFSYHNSDIETHYKRMMTQMDINYLKQNLNWHTMQTKFQVYGNVNLPFGFVKNQDLNNKYFDVGLGIKKKNIPKKSQNIELTEFEKNANLLFQNFLTDLLNLQISHQNDAYGTIDGQTVHIKNNGECIIKQKITINKDDIINPEVFQAIIEEKERIEKYHESIKENNQ